MEAIVNVLMGAGALGAGIFCYVLSRRLSALSSLEGGMGGAIAVLSAQVDDMTRALTAARAAAGESAQTLQMLNGRAEQSAQRLELLMASLHDLPETPERPRHGRRRVVHKGSRHRFLTGLSPQREAGAGHPDQTPEEAA